MADTAYDVDHFHQAIAARGALAAISNTPSSTRWTPSATSSVSPSPSSCYGFEKSQQGLAAT